MSVRDQTQIIKNIWNDNGNEGKAAVVTVAAGIAAIVILSVLVCVLI